MANLHFFAVSDRGVSTANNDAFCAEKIGNYHVFGVLRAGQIFPVRFRKDYSNFQPQGICSES